LRNNLHVCNLAGFDLQWCMHVHYLSVPVSYIHQVSDLQAAKQRSMRAPISTPTTAEVAKELESFAGPPKPD
jgi:hypothetical protein